MHKAQFWLAIVMLYKIGRRTTVSTSSLADDSDDHTGFPDLRVTSGSFLFVHCIMWLRQDALNKAVECH